MSHEANLGAFSDVVTLTSAPQQIADHIMSAIAVGALPEGTLLPGERDLAASLQVSRSSVRAALDRLERMGFVIRKRGRGGGTFVAHTEARAFAPVASRLQDFHAERHHLLDARACLQGLLSGLAAVRRTAAEVTVIDSLVAEYALADHASTARGVDARLHHAIAKASHNPELERLAVDLDRKINAGFRHDPYSPQLHEQADHDHRLIAEAIQRGDQQQAASLCEEHFRSTTMLPATTDEER